MKHAIDLAVPSRPRRSRLAPVGLLFAGVLALSACATTPGAVSPSPTETGTQASPSPTSSSSPVTSETPSSTPTSGDSGATDAPYNGQILIVTSELHDGRLEVSAMVPGVAESGGTCTLTLVSTGVSVAAPANEGKDVTYCGLMSIAVSDAEKDPAFQVAYTSRNVSAKSAVTTIESTS